jgi:hypothetical protein
MRTPFQVENEDDPETSYPDAEIPKSLISNSRIEQSNKTNKCKTNEEKKTTITTERLPDKTTAEADECKKTASS